MIERLVTLCFNRRGIVMLVFALVAAMAGSAGHNCRWKAITSLSISVTVGSRSCVEQTM